MMDLSKFEFFKKGKAGNYKTGAKVVFYANGPASITSEIGETLGDKVDLGITSDGLQMCIKNGSTFTVTANGRATTPSKKIYASKAKSHIANCGIEFPATYSFVYTDGVWIGVLQHQQ
jgi:hypothetical protein